MKLTRPQPLSFDLPDGRALTVPPPTVDQVRAATMLDPADPKAETATQAESRLTLQTAAFLTYATLDGDAVIEPMAFLGSITPGERNQIRLAIAAHLDGYDPQSALDLQRHAAALLKKKAFAKGIPPTEPQLSTK